MACAWSAHRYVYYDEVLNAVKGTPAGTKGLSKDTQQLARGAAQDAEHAASEWPLEEGAEMVRCSTCCCVAGNDEVLQEVYLQTASSAWVGVRRRGGRVLCWSTEQRAEATAPDMAKLVDELAAKQTPLLLGTHS